MRFAGSIYDILRQPGVFQQLERETNGNHSRMSKAVLARLRFDDLLSNDSVDDLNPRLVMSLSDVLDGRLFTLLQPGDLKGLGLEVICDPKFASNRKTAVLRMVRHYIQNEDGQGRPAFFLAVPASVPDHVVAREISGMDSLNVEKLSDAGTVIRNAGYEPEAAKRLVGHWRMCAQLVKNGDLILRPFPSGRGASAAPNLREILNRDAVEIRESGKMKRWGLTRFGVAAFRESLRRLAASQGRRDAPMSFLEKLRADSDDDDDVREVEMVMAIFAHYMFAAIAFGNRACPEHSASLGEADYYAFRADYLDKVEPLQGDHHTIPLSPRIVSGLGGLTARQYEDVRESMQGKLAMEIERLKASEGPKRDLSGLRDACDALAKEVGKSREPGAVPTGISIRRIALEPTLAAGVAAVGCLLDFALSPEGGSVARTTATVSGVAAMGLVVKKAATRAIADVECRLFARSLVRSTADASTGTAPDASA